MTGSALELHDVTVTYDDRTVLNVPCLDVRRGEVLTLLGENGSGKTTLLRLLGLLIRPARGRVVLGEEEVDFRDSKRLLGLRRRMAAVMQEPLLCRMTVRQNVALGLHFRRFRKSAIEERVETWLEKLSIPHLGDRPAWRLSGGEAQRVSLARAMALDPEVLLLDEPFAALDAPTRQSLLQEFRGILADSSVSAVFATHDRGEALGMGDRVAVLLGGRVAQLGSADTVFYRPEGVEVARFVGMETVIPGRVTGGADGLVKVGCGEYDLESEGEWEAGEEVYLLVRPEEVGLHEGRGSAPAGERNVLDGRVAKVVPAEMHYRVEVDCGVPVVAVVGRASFRGRQLEPGRPVQVTFPARAVHLIKRRGD